MTTPTPTTPDGAPAAPAPVPTPPATPAPAAPPPAEPKIVTMTQDQLDQLLAARLDRQKAASEKTFEERLAEIESTSKAQIAASETTAISAIVREAAATAHDPAVVAKLVDLSGLTSADGEAIRAKVAEFLTANAWLVNAAQQTPVLKPAPGVTTTGTTLLMGDAELEAISAEELSKDPEKMKLFLETVEQRKRS